MHQERGRRGTVYCPHQGAGTICTEPLSHTVNPVYDGHHFKPGDAEALLVPAPVAFMELGRKTDKIVTHRLQFSSCACCHIFKLDCKVPIQSTGRKIDVLRPSLD